MLQLLLTDLEITFIELIVLIPSNRSKPPSLSNDSMEETDPHKQFLPFLLLILLVLKYSPLLFTTNHIPIQL